ncbi:LuxR C-terminal-related transcriptional regulator, partial [Vibrio owensii]|uniref:helix-turn-helix transcriptional regulator n=1 Tax=Vibrio owensii TaxID=696485 RepID=UPI003391635E
AQDIEQTLHKLRDLPINLLVVESRFLSTISPAAFHELLEPYYRGAILVLHDGLTAEIQQDDSKAIVVKANTLMETSARILQQAQQNTVRQQAQQKELTQLSERELTVAKMLVEGLTNKEIALQLDINQKTVSTYKARV